MMTWQVWGSFIIQLIVPMVMTSLTTDYYRQIKRCTSAQSLGTVIQSFPVTSRIRCASACSTLSTCKTFSMSSDGSRTCYLHSEPPTVLTCPSGETSYQKLSASPCLNNGVYNVSTDSCHCYDGYIGSRCEKIMEDCTEGYESGIYEGERDVFRIFPLLAPTPFHVSCWMSAGGRTLMHHQIFANVSFDRSWAEYKAGFGGLTNDHWLGNDHVFYITNSRPQVLKVSVVSVDDPDVPTSIVRSHYYRNFKISNESDKYRLTFTSDWSENDLGDCLTSLKDAPFSTIDVNNVDTCATDYNAGWWYTTGSCTTCNLNGMLRRHMTYWNENITVSHWKPILNDFHVLEAAMFLVAAN